MKEKQSLSLSRVAKYLYSNGVIQIKENGEQIQN